MTDLPDVNVWLALADENHLHHPRALAYWRGESSPLDRILSGNDAWLPAS